MISVRIFILCLREATATFLVVAAAAAWNGSGTAPYLAAVPPWVERNLAVPRELCRADLHNKLHRVLTQLAVARVPPDVQEKCARSAGDIMANLQRHCLDDFPVVNDLQLAGRGHVRVVV